jgi:hypothetical protein
MSGTLLSLAQQYLEGRLSPVDFASKFIEGWKFERDSDLLVKDDPVLSELLSDVFSLADNFNPDEDREDYEFNELQFFQLVRDRVNEYRLI